MRPLTPEMINYIQYGTEERRWEFKPPLHWHKGQHKRKFEIAKAVFALSNITNGGFVVFGITQQRDRTDGNIFERSGLTIRQFNSFDSKDDIARFFSGKTNQAISFEVFGGVVEIGTANKRFVVVQVYESQEAVPAICTYNYRTRDRRCRLEEGNLYIRSLSDPIESRVIKTSEEWTELIRRLLGRKEEIIYKDLEAVCKIMKFKGPQEETKEAKKAKSTVRYDKYLKRDKL